jgi:hypothetical protein
MAMVAFALSVHYLDLPILVTNIEHSQLQVCEKGTWNKVTCQKFAVRRENYD